MKQKSATKKTAICAALAVLAVAASGVALGSSYALKRADGAEFTENPFADNYIYGTQITMPSEVVLTYGGKEYTATKGYVRYPDGRAYSGASFELDSYGSYTVVYEAKAEGKTVFAEHSFLVSAESYTVGKNSAYATGTLNPNFGTDVQGLKITLAAGESFTYNYPVNVYENAENELISFNCMQFDPVAREITVRLTDCYDPSVYIDILYSKVAYSETYILAGAYGKSVCGVWNGAAGGRTTVIDGAEYKLNERGTAIPGNRKKERHDGLTSDRYNNITLSLNTSDKKNVRVLVDTSPEKPKNNVVTELNNSDLYNYSFDGFTTGEVYLSVTATNVVGADSVEIEIASLAGLTGEDLAPDTITDTTPPEIVLASASDSINVMAGVYVSVPGATAYDTSGLKGKVSYAVYYGYGTDFEKNVSVRDGKFLPELLGAYTVEYVAVDRFGNAGVNTITMNAVKSGEEGIEFTCEKIADAAAGELVSAGNFTAVSLNGTAEVKISVTDPEGRVRALSSAEEVFLLERAGTYVVSYVYSDGLYEGTYSYEFTAADEGIYRFESRTVPLPRYLIRGAEYSVEALKAFVYSAQEPKSAEVNAYIRYDGGEYSSFDPAGFTVGSGNTLQIRFACKNDPDVFVESETVTITDVGYKSGSLNLANYFAGDFEGSVSQETPDYLSYALTTCPSGSLNFVNPLLLSSFRFRFSLSGNAQVRAFTVVLTDFYNRKNETRIRFSGTAVSLDGTEKTVLESWIDSPFTLVYDSTGTLSLGGTTFTHPLSFTADKILFSVEFEGVAAGGTFNVYSVCNQTFGYYVTSDNIKPLLSVNNPDRVADVGDVISLARPEAADVLSPSAAENCVLSVYRNGSVVRATDGTELKEVYAFADYSFRISDFGTYLIVYKYTDGAGKSDDIRWTIKVTDNICPEITLERYDGKPVSVSVNKAVEPIAYTVSDNITAAENLDVFIVVYNENGARVCASRDTFTLTQAGVYTVYLYCTDEAGNTAYVTYLVKAK